MGNNNRTKMLLEPDRERKFRPSAVDGRVFKTAFLFLRELAGSIQKPDPDPFVNK